MPTSLRVSIAVALLALSFGLGYSLAPSRPVDPPTRAKRDVAVSPGLASELQAALVLPELLDRVEAVTRILRPLGPDALDEVRAGYESVNLDLGDVELVLLADWWAGFDPSAAFGWARDSKIGWHPAVLTATVRTWARRDPEAAAREIRAALQDERLMAAAMVGLVHGWDEAGHDGLETYLSGMPAGSLRAVDVLARIRIARAGAESAFDWAQELPAGDPRQASFRSEAIERVLEASTDSDPQVAAAWAEQIRGEDPGPRGSVGLVLRVAMRWARKDGAAAMQWLSKLPPATDIPPAVEETYRSWYISDSQAATAWLASVELEPWLEPAVVAFALQRSASDPDEALVWAMRVRDPALRERTLVKIGASYSVAAPEQADAWLARAELPDPVREKIQTFRRNRAPASGAPVPPPAPAQPDGTPTP
jgi:hypothetical protein